MNISFLVLTSFTGYAQQEFNFNTLDSLFSFAENNSSVIKTNEQQVILTKYEKIAAITNAINLRNPISASITDNNELPVNFIPAQLLGGPAGTFKEITLGQKYVSNFNLAPQIDIISPAAWVKIKSADIDQELTNTNNLINKETLFESIAACFFNIITLKEQIEFTNRNLASSDSILMVVQQKYDLGQVRQQDVNDAKTDQLTLKDKLKQLQVTLDQQNNSLKILLDVPITDKVTIGCTMNYNQIFQSDLPVTTDLHYKVFQLEAESIKEDLKFNWLSNLPVVSLFYSYSYYQNSNNRFFDLNVGNSKWLSAGFIGVKLTFSFPDLNRMVLIANSKINYNISRINRDHNKNQNELSNNQLQLDYQKAYSQYVTSQQISLLKEQNYRLSFSQYQQDILSMDKLLTSLDDMLISRQNYSSSTANLLYTKTKIELNNTIK